MTATTTKGSDRARNAQIVNIYRATSDPRGFFESVLGFEKMANRWFRVSAAAQRYYFGNVPFGKRAIKVDESGKVSVFKSQAFGQDFDVWEFHFDHSSKKWVHGDDRRDCGLPCSA